MQNLKHFFLFGCLTILVSCTLSDKKKTKEKISEKGYSISGFNYTNADSIYLYNKDYEILQKSKITDKEISLQGKIDTVSVVYLKLNNSEEFNPFVLENETYKVLFSNTDNMIIGGSLNTELTDYQKINEKKAIEKSNLRDLLSDKKINIDSYLLKINIIEANQKKQFKKFIKENENNILTEYLIKQKGYSSEEVLELKWLLKKSNNTSLKSYLNKLYKNKIVEEAVAKIENRPLAKEFSGTNLKRRVTSLADVKKDKKAVLIDFWASWCGPCRKLSPRIRRLYFDYFDKGFDIITVSQDRSISAWELGTSEDGMEIWNHVYDDDNDIAKMYGVRGIPHMVLLDDKGRIIKDKITIDALEYELKRIFK